MVIYKCGQLKNYKYWGCFQDIHTYKNIIFILHKILSKENVKSVENLGKFIFAINMDKHLMIIRNGYYGFITNDNIFKIFKEKIEYFPVMNTVLVLGTEYIDDIPRYITATDFCRKIVRGYSAKCFIIKK